MVGLAEKYCKGRDISRGYCANVMRTARKMAAAGITESSISGERVWHWLSSLKAAGAGPVTVASERRTAVTLWRYGIDLGVIQTPIRDLPRPKMPRRVTRAFSRDDLTRLVKFFTTCDFGLFRSGCPKNLWLEAWVRTAYESGIRFGDLHALRDDCLTSEGLAIVASKTGMPVIRRLSPRTRSLLTQLSTMSPDGTIFRWAVSRRHAFAAVRQCFKAAGLPQGRTQWLRRAGATHAEIAQPGSAAAFLGHSDGGTLASRHYIDFTQLMARMPSPPPLE
jgi:integrase